MHFSLFLNVGNTHSDPYGRQMLILSRFILPSVVLKFPSILSVGIWW